MDSDKLFIDNPWIISDTHLFHTNIIKYCNRPFNNIDEMNLTIINNWNSKISSNDNIVHLGDFALTTKSNFIELIKILNGNIFLMIGNHDRFSVSFYERNGISVIAKRDLVIQWENIYFSHRPVIVPENYYNIHGHIHEKESEYKNQINVSIEQMNYKPIKLFELIERRMK